MNLKVYSIILLLFAINNYCYCKLVCGSVDVRNSMDDFDGLKNCSIVLGNIQIAFMDNTNKSDWVGISFPQIREITEYLIVYRVQGLQSLGKLFPNLAVIRGYKLAFDYAMIVYDNNDLTEIALNSLTTIKRGYVRIEKNILLCNLRSIDWSAITHTNDNMIDLESKCPENVNNTCDHCPDRLCWESNVCQKLEKKQFACNFQCLGGCSTPRNSKSCTACRYFNDHGNCVERCSADKFVYDNYLCLNKEECTRSKRLPFSGACRDRCPPNYKQVPEVGGFCQKCIDNWDNCTSFCDGNHTLSDMASIQTIKGCKIINGTLEIRHINTEQTIAEMYPALGSVKEIFGALIIAQNIFKSLDFFTNLTVIHGHHLENDYALSVMDNPNLRKLFNWSEKRNFTIANGKLYFHYNPKLCLTEIEKLRKKCNLNYNITTLEISRNSNGDHAQCSFDLIDTEMKYIASTWAIIEWSSYRPPKTHTMYGYQIFYSTYDSLNKSSYYIPEVCQDKLWQEDVYILSDTERDSKKKQIFNKTLENLQPYRKYSYYITSLLLENSTYSDSTRDVGAFSKIKVFKTLPDEPSRPHNVQAFNISYNKIKLKWKPPYYPNGVLTKYVITLYLQQYERKFIDERNYCLVPKLPDDQQLQGFYTGLNDFCQSDDSGDETKFVSLDSLDENDGSDDRIIDDCDNFKYMTNQAAQKKGKNDNFGLDLRKRDLTTIQDLQEKIRRLPTGEYQVYYEIVNASKNEELIIDNLLHYSIYQIFISACNEGIDVELCSTVAMVTQRTSPKPNADDVDILKSPRPSSLFWLEPKSPNAIILYYTIELVNVLDKPSTLLLCLPRKQHERNQFIYILNLPDATYQIRVRATSLYGNGNWSQSTIVLIKSPNWAIYFIILEILFAIFVLIYLRNYNFYEVQIIFPAIEIIRPNIGIESKLFELALGKMSSTLYRGKFCEFPCLVNVLNHKKFNFGHKKIFFNGADLFMGMKTEFLLRILGVISKHPPYVIVFEYPEEGVLNNYLKRCSLNEVTIPQKYLYQWAAEVADGMAYLASKNFTHGDLTTNNILLTKDFTIKISKLNLGRTISSEDYIQIDENTFVPLRWTCKEILLKNQKQLSVESDVWSYGVVLWEMANCYRFSKPYHRLNNLELIHYLKVGGILESPIRMPTLLSKIMMQCFNNIENRPSFQDIVLVDFATQSKFHDNSFVFNSISVTATTVMRLNPSNTSVKVHFRQSGGNTKSIVSDDEEALLENEPCGSNDVWSECKTRNNYDVNIIRNYFQITADDWKEWKRSRNGREILISFRNCNR